MSFDCNVWGKPPVNSLLASGIGKKRLQFENIG